MSLMSLIPTTNRTQFEKHTTHHREKPTKKLNPFSIFHFHRKKKLNFIFLNSRVDTHIPMSVARIAAQLCMSDVQHIERIMNAMIEQCAKTKTPLSEIVGVIPHKGIPNHKQHECSKCRAMKDADQFTWYPGRRDKNQHLMRSNAICKPCGKENLAEKNATLKRARESGKIPPKPAAGAVCPNCKRNWGTPEEPRNWHQDHDAIQGIFRMWLCGDCNMAKHDHRHGIS